jgi:hypothetical protein
MPLTKQRLSLYWKCQLIGWSIAALYWTYQGLKVPDYSVSLGIMHFITDVVLYITITHLYRNFSIKHRWHNLGAAALIKRLIPAAIVLGILFMLVTGAKIYLLRIWLIPGYNETFTTFFKANAETWFVTGTRLMSIWLLAYHLYHYSQREIAIAKENARLAIITKEVQLNNLSSQLNPHFLFNSLNNIKALVIEDPTLARRGIDLLSEILRTSLDNRNAALIPIKNEIELVHDYLELEKLRLEERLAFCVNLEKQAEDILVPRLAIQTLVENAIKHGINRQKKGGCIKVNVTRKQEAIEITVQNPGGLLIKESNGMGLKNLRERIELQYKGRASFMIYYQADGNVEAKLEIPTT